MSGGQRYRSGNHLPGGLELSKVPLTGEEDTALRHLQHLKTLVEEGEPDDHVRRLVTRVSLQFTPCRGFRTPDRSPSPHLLRSLPARRALLLSLEHPKYFLHLEDFCFLLFLLPEVLLRQVFTWFSPSHYSDFC